MLKALRSNSRIAAWFYGYKAPERGAITLGHRRVYIMPTRLGMMFAATLLIMLVGSINYVASLPVDEHVSRITANVLRKFLEER